MGRWGWGVQALSPDASDPNLALVLSLGLRIPSVSGGTQIRLAGAARSISMINQLRAGVQVTAIQGPGSRWQYGVSVGFGNYQQSSDTRGY